MIYNTTVHCGAEAYACRMGACVRACVRAGVRACVRAGVRACVRACVRVCGSSPNLAPLRPCPQFFPHRARPAAHTHST